MKCVKCDSILYDLNSILRCNRCANAGLPNLSRTIAALKRYDAEIAELEEEMREAETMIQIDIAAAKAMNLERDVGVAYGLDTADRNNPLTCASTVRPGPAIPGVGQELSFVRRMVQLASRA